MIEAITKAEAIEKAKSALPDINKEGLDFYRVPVFEPLNVTINNDVYPKPKSMGWIVDFRKRYDFGMKQYYWEFISAERT